MAEPTRLAPSLSPLQALLVSKRHQRQARKWPWAWWCTECDDAYGAAKTRPQAEAAALRHNATAHQR